MSEISAALFQLDPADPQYAARFVERLLDAAVQVGASDVHLQPTRQGLEVRWRLDGVLQALGEFPQGQSAQVVNRLKVLAELLTYASERPQEGRIRNRDGEVEMRVSTFPTLHGERAVVRLFGGAEAFQCLADLKLPESVAGMLGQLLRATSGAVVFSGQAGSGKTTSAYACLRELKQSPRGPLNLMTLEDPIEVALDGVSQSQVSSGGEFDLAGGIRAVLRHDPDVLMIGEIRDPATARAALNASLTGHLILTTFHARSATAALHRLAEMGIEAYLLTSGLLGVVNQRLVRRLCPACRRPAERDADFLGLNVATAWTANGCSQCWGNGYRGQLALAELLPVGSGALHAAMLQQAPPPVLQQLAVEAGMISCSRQGAAAVESGETSPAEIHRVFGGEISDISTSPADNRGSPAGRVQQKSAQQDSAQQDSAQQKSAQHRTTAPRSQALRDSGT